MKEFKYTIDPKNYIYNGPTASFTKGEKYKVLDNKSSMWLVINASGDRESIPGKYFKQITQLTDDFIDDSCEGLSKLYPHMSEESIKNLHEYMTCDVRKKNLTLGLFPMEGGFFVGEIKELNVVNYCISEEENIRKANELNIKMKKRNENGK